MANPLLKRLFKEGPVTEPWLQQVVDDIHRRFVAARIEGVNFPAMSQEEAEVLWQKVEPNYRRALAGANTATTQWLKQMTGK